MITSHITWLIVTLFIYCLCNSMILTGLLGLWHVPRSMKLFKNILLKTALAVVLTLAFLYFISKMFCWIALFMTCVECICWPAASQVFDMQTISAHLLFFFGVTSMQLGLLPIPKQVKPLLFVGMVIASNALATIIKLALVTVVSL